MWPPKFKTIECEPRCNLLCYNCTQWQSPSTKPSSFKKLELELADTLVVHLSGGDPLLYPELTELLYSLRQQNKLILLSSNFLASGAIAPQTLRLIHLPIIYLPAIGEYYSKVFCGKNTWQQTLNSLALLNEMSKKHLIIYELYPENFVEIPDFIQLTKKSRYRFTAIQFNPQDFSKQQTNYIYSLKSSRQIIDVIGLKPGTQSKFCRTNILFNRLGKHPLRLSLFLWRAFYKMYLRV